ncbi:hypothetical protein JCM8115_006568 [Rhodotorula mucilaginosa]
MVSPEEELATFLRMAPINLGSEPSLSPDLDFAYTPIELDVGEFVSCVRWDGAYYMIGTDVARTLAFRLSLHGEQVAELRQLKRTVCSRLRSIKEGHGMLLEPANSQLLTLLFQHDLVSTRKSQKLFRWFEVPHDQLLDLELGRRGGDSSRTPSFAATSDSTTSSPRPDSPNSDSSGPRPRVFPWDSTRPVNATLEDPTRRYGCGIGSCKRRFTRLEHAQRHRAIHTQEKSFGCDQCGKAFARKDNADAHVSTGSIDCARTTATS